MTSTAVMTSESDLRRCIQCGGWYGGEFFYSNGRGGMRPRCIGCMTTRRQNQKRKQLGLLPYREAAPFMLLRKFNCESLRPELPHPVLAWQLRLLVTGLAAHLESLERADDLWDTGMQSEDYLAPYNLQPDDAHTVMMVAWGKQCVDCGDVSDFYMVYDRIWRDAGLEPHQCCCRKCLAVRLGRPLEQADFEPCPLNYRTGALPEPADADLHFAIENALAGSPPSVKEEFENWARRKIDESLPPAPGASCNNTERAKQLFADWLDEQWAARLSEAEKGGM